jgi:hypothetical protein
MDRNRAVVVGALTALALGGCIGIPLHISSVEEDLPKKAAPIVVGQAARAQVRQALGEPLIASEYWRFDAFRISDWNVGVAVRDLQLRATAKETFLAVPPDRRDQYLKDVPEREWCRVLVGAPHSISEATLRLDAQPGPTLPATMTDTLLLLRLAPGSHWLEILGNGATKAGTARIECAAGALIYAALQVLPSVGGSNHPSIEIVVSSDRPYGFEYQALLIWGNGQWLVPQEPQDGARQGR